MVFFFIKNVILKYWFLCLGNGLKRGLDFILEYIYWFFLYLGFGVNFVERLYVNILWIWILIKGYKFGRG